MSMFKDPFDPKALLSKRCSCGGAHAEADHGRLTATAVPVGEEARWERVVDAAVLRAVFPVDAQRRLFRLPFPDQVEQVARLPLAVPATNLQPV